MQASRVLIIEDDDKLSRLYEKTLSQFQIQTRRVFKVSDAHPEMMRFAPDVIVLDWFLGQEDVRPILEKLSRFPRESLPPIAVISGHATAKDTDPYNNLIYATVTKPISIRAFAELIAELSADKHNRLPLYNIGYECHDEKAIYVLLEGEVDVEALQTQLPTITRSCTLILDVRNLALVRINLDRISDWLGVWGALFQTIHIIHTDDNLEKVASRVLLRHLLPAIPHHYHASYTDALAALVV